MDDGGHSPCSIIRLRIAHSHNMTIINVATLPPTSSLDINPLPLLALRNTLPYLLLVQLLLIKLRRELRIALPLDILQRSQVIAESVFLLAQGLAQVLPERDECRAHHAVRDELVVVCLQQEENNPRREDEVPLLHTQPHRQISFNP